MIRRCPTPLTILAAAVAASVGSWSISSHADVVNAGSQVATATYTLTSTTAIPVPGANITAPQVEAIVEPTGGVVAPSGGTGPLTILSGSSGFDPTQLVDALKSTTDSSGNPVQEFGLVFFGQGLAAGGVLNFSLTVEGSLSTAPVLQSITPGVTIALDSFKPISSGGSGSTSNAGGASPETVPEPLSILIWAALACAGLVWIRARRGARPVALAG